MYNKYNNACNFDIILSLQIKWILLCADEFRKCFVQYAFIPVSVSLFVKY